MVSEVCARRYGAGGIRDGGKGSAKEIVGRSPSGAAVGVAEEESLERAGNRPAIRPLILPVQVLLGSPLRMKDRPSEQPSASPRLFSSSPHSAQKFSLKLETEEVDFSRTLTYPST